MPIRSEEHTSELQSLRQLVCRLLLEKKRRTGESIGRVTAWDDGGGSGLRGGGGGGGVTARDDGGVSRLLVVRDGLLFFFKGSGHPEIHPSSQPIPFPL